MGQIFPPTDWDKQIYFLGVHWSWGQFRLQTFHPLLLLHPPWSSLQSVSPSLITLWDILHFYTLQRPIKRNQLKSGSWRQWSNQEREMSKVVYHNGSWKANVSHFQAAGLTARAPPRRPDEARALQLLHFPLCRLAQDSGLQSAGTERWGISAKAHGLPYFPLENRSWKPYLWQL